MEKKIIRGEYPETIAEFFKNLVGVYCPNTIDKVFSEFGDKIIYGLLKKYVFNDGSVIETYGRTVVSVNGRNSEDLEINPSDAWFMGYMGL